MDLGSNAKARFNYEILEEVEAGIALLGTEVKSLREKKANLTDAYANLKGDEMFLTNLRIDPYARGGSFNHESARPRRLLLHRREIDRLAGKLRERGLVLVPLKMYFKGRNVKVLLGLGKGKKLHDKRASIREREARREVDREMKNRR